MTALHLDWETRSACDLKVAGLDNYAKHETTDIWIASYAFDEEPVLVWNRGEPCPQRIIDHVKSGGVVIGHNVAFEIALWTHVAVPKYDWPELKPEQCVCTMALAYSMSLPGALENAAAAVGLSATKDMAGHRVMMQLAKPKTIDPLTWHDDPEKIAKLIQYGKQDVEVERALHKRLIALPKSEQALWLLDHKINNRGIYVDRPAVKAAIKVVESEQKRLNDEMRRVTNNAVATCTATGQLGDWIRYRGVTMPGVAKADVLDALKDDDLPADVRTALRLRQEAAKTSTAKLKKMIESASEDGRLRGMFQYWGAATGRWAARKVQLHNLPRPKLKQPDIERVVDVLRGPMKVADKARLIEMLFGAPLDVISSCLRAMLCAAPGRELIAADFANIEGRVIAWLAGEDWKLQAFRDFDAGIGHDIYKLTYGRSFGVDPATVNGDQRQIGKTQELLLGFQGGIGAIRRGAGALVESMPDAELQSWVDRWRSSHTKVVKWWYELEDAAIRAVQHPGEVFGVGAPGRVSKFKVNGSFLWCKLPSGRNLCYPYAKLRPIETPWGTIKEQVHYMTVDSLSNKWVETHSYGGKFAENITQAVARDLLAEAMKRVEVAGYPVCLHVHDELVCEVDATAPPDTLHRIETLMQQLPPWAAGLPVATEGWRGTRYRKG